MSLIDITNVKYSLTSWDALIIITAIKFIIFCVKKEVIISVRCVVSTVDF